MEPTVLIAIIGTIATILGSVITYFTTKKKQGAEVDSIAIVTAERADKINETLLKRVLLRLEHVEMENAELLKELRAIKVTNRELNHKLQKIADLLVAANDDALVPRESIRDILR